MHAIAQTDYYYYKGNKIPLTVNENKVCISIPKYCDETCGRIRANVQVLTNIKDDYFDIFVITQSDYDNLNSLDSWEEDSKSVILTHSYFTESNEEVFATPYLNVRLKKEEDKEILNSYGEEYKLRVVRNSPLMPLWYIIAVTPDSEKSPLECANELYETGCFAASTPDLATTNSLDETTVHNITIATREESSDFYDLQGRHLDSQPTNKGIYIQNGKKIVVK
jgi:hypothetical protein